MKYRLLAGLALAAIAWTTLVPCGDPLLVSLAALADEIRSYGRNGRDGRDGRHGQDGRPGRANTVRVDGTPQTVSTVGRDGADGADGEAGARPSCRAQPRGVRYDLQAPDGGDGGDGGNGGNGGNGGDVTLYYQEAAHLRLVTVDAQGGQPGRSGRGGRGTVGCRCRDRDWRVEVCNGPDCKQERYICRDGDAGRNGRHGRHGQVGQPGQLWLVNQLDPLAPETPTQIQALETFIRQPVALSKNLWERRSGAAALLASGSSVADTYQQYVGRVEGQAQVVWSAERSPTAFLANSPTVTLEPSGDIQWQFPDTLWVDGRSDQVGTLTTYTITAVVRAADVAQLALGSQRGRGDTFQLAVIDLAAESDHLTTEFDLVYRTTNDNPLESRRVRYTTRYDGSLPPEVVTRDNNRFILALGQLPVGDRYFQPGTYAQVDLQIRRSLGANSATQTLTWQGQL